MQSTLQNKSAQQPCAGTSPSVASNPSSKFRQMYAFPGKHRLPLIDPGSGNFRAVCFCVSTQCTGTSLSVAGIAGRNARQVYIFALHVYTCFLLPLIDVGAAQCLHVSVLVRCDPCVLTLLGSYQLLGCQVFLPLTILRLSQLCPCALS